MQNENFKLKIVSTAAMSAILAVFFVTIITVAAELWPPLKEWLKTMFTHHWVGKSVLVAALYLGRLALIFFIANGATMERLNKILKCLFWLGIAGTLIIFGFFTAEAFHIFN